MNELAVPLIGVAGVALSGLIVGGFAVWNRRRGATESKVPTVAESWQRAEDAQAQLDIERSLRRQYQSWTLTLRDLVHRIVVLFGAGTVTLTHDEHEALEGTPTISKEN